MQSIIFLIGFMGSGKSYQANMLSHATKIPAFDLDKIIEDEMQLSIKDIFTQKGESFFRLKESEILKSIKLTSSKIISCGGGTPCYFDNMKWMNENGTTIYLNPSIEIIFERLKRNKFKRPLIAHMSDIDLKNFIKTKIAEREIFYKQCKFEITDETIDLNWFTNTIIENNEQ